MSWAKKVEKSTVESGSRWLFWHLPSPMLIQARFWHSKLRRICYLTWSTKHKLDSSGFGWGKHTLDSSAKPCVIGNLLALHIMGIRDLRVVLPLVLQWPQKYISHWISSYRNQDVWKKERGISDRHPFAIMTMRIFWWFPRHSMAFTSGALMNYATWGTRGWCRVERTATALSAKAHGVFPRRKVVGRELNNCKLELENRKFP